MDTIIWCLLLACFGLSSFILAKCLLAPSKTYFSMNPVTAAIILMAISLIMVLEFVSRVQRYNKINNRH